MKKTYTVKYKFKGLLSAVAGALLLSMLVSCTGGGDTPATSTGSTSTTAAPVPGTPGTPSSIGASTGASTGADTGAASTAPEPVTITIDEGSVSAAQAIIYDVSARRALYSRNQVIDGKVYPASTTKLFTAWLALQYLSPEEIITAGDELALLASDAAIAYIKKGHRLSASMLVEAMLLPSGGDAAYIIAAAAGKKILGNETASGKAAVDAFIEEMNRRLPQLGFNGTHFSNPDGYHSPDHYTTLEDIAGIAALALENKTIMQYAVLPSDRVQYASGQSNTWKNTNDLIQPDSINYCADAIGLKTGSTDEAGYCVITAAKGADGRYYIVGIFGGSNSSSRFSDAATLIGYALGKR